MMNYFKIITFAVLCSVMSGCLSEPEPKEPVVPVTNEQKINYNKFANFNGSIVGIRGDRLRDKRLQNKKYTYQVIFYDRLKVIPRGAGIPEQYTAGIPVSVSLFDVSTSTDISTQKAARRFAIEFLQRTACRLGKVGVVERLATKRLSQAQIAGVLASNNGKLAGGRIPPNILAEIKADERAARNKPRVIVDYNTWPYLGPSVFLTCTYNS